MITFLNLNNRLEILRIVPRLSYLLLQPVKFWAVLVLILVAFEIPVCYVNKGHCSGPAIQNNFKLRFEWQHRLRLLLIIWHGALMLFVLGIKMLCRRPNPVLL